MKVKVIYRKTGTYRVDHEAKVENGKIVLSLTQKRLFRDEGTSYLTDEQQLIFDKFTGRKLSIFPEGWDAFYQPDLLYEYIYGEPCLEGMHPFNNEEKEKEEKEDYSIIFEVQ